MRQCGPSRRGLLSNFTSRHSVCCNQLLAQLPSNRPVTWDLGTTADMRLLTPGTRLTAYVTKSTAVLPQPRLLAYTALLICNVEQLLRLFCNRKHGKLLVSYRMTNSYQDTLPDEVLGALAEMVKCRACCTLTNSTWQLGTNWLHKMGQQMSDRELTEHMQAMCEILVRTVFTSSIALCTVLSC